MPICKLELKCLCFAVIVCCSVPAAASDCTKTSTGLVALNDLREGMYKGKQGGLYPGGASTRPLAHELAGLEQARGIRPLDASGQVSHSGKIVLLSIGMSNTTQEFSTFKPLADADPDKNPNLIIVDGAQGGMTAGIIINLNSANGQQYWSNVDSRLRAAGVTAAQVQAAWIKEADAGPTQAFPNDALILKPEFAEIARILKTRFPNIRLAYYSSRIYAGYASSALNPEPYAYQSGFAVKWLIEDQINGAADLNYDPTHGPVRAPWLAWGPYLWADGLNARSDGLSYVCSDLADDGTHPAAGGARNKVARLLLDFLKTDSTSKIWFLNARAAALSSLAFPTITARSGTAEEGPAPLLSGFAATNLSGSEVALTFTAVDTNGTVISGTGISNPKAITLAAGAQLAMMDEQIFGTGISAVRTPVWARLDGKLDRIAGFFLLFNRDLSVMDGAPAVSKSTGSWIFPEISDRGLMQLHIANGNATPVAITLQMVQADGTPRGTPANHLIRAGGVMATRLAELFPGLSFSATDYLRATASQGVLPLELFGSPGRYLAALNGLDTSAGASLLYCPQYATGGSWRTDLSIVNLDAISGTVSLEYLNDAGVPQAPVRSLPIPSRGKIYIKDPVFFLDPGTGLSQGYLRINGNGVKLAGSVLFGDARSETFAAALPLVAQFDANAVLSQMVSGDSWFTGIALLNPADLAAGLSLEAFDAKGIRLASRNEILAPRQRRSLLLTQFFPDLEGRELSSGYINVASDRPIGTFAVYGTRDLSSLAAIPAQPLP